VILGNPSASKTQYSLKEVPRDVNNEAASNAKHDGERPKMLVGSIKAGVMEIFGELSPHLSPDGIDVDRLKSAARNWSKLSLRSRNSSISNSIDTKKTKSAADNQK
jgi:hypothetical protein